MLREQDQKFQEAMVDDASKNGDNSTRKPWGFPRASEKHSFSEEDELLISEEYEQHRIGDGPSDDESFGKVGLILKLNAPFKCFSF